MPNRRNTGTVGLVAVAFLVVLWSCVPDAPAGLDGSDGASGPDGSGDPAPTTGSLSASVPASGEEVPDGFTMTLDDSVTVLVPPSGSFTWMDVPPGQHSVTLGTVPDNCGTVVSNPQVVRVEAGEESATSFPVSCVATRGELRIEVETGGDDGVDRDGYRIDVEAAGVSERVGLDATLVIPDLVPGDYRVRLRDVNRDCETEDGRDRTVPVEAGRTTDVTFSVTCFD